MYKFESSIYIERPQQEVFEYYTNPVNQPKWQSGLESAEWISEVPHGTGSKMKTVTNFLGRKIEAELEITRWDPPREMGFKALGGPIPFESTTMLEVQGDGTLVTQRTQGEFSGFFKLAEGLVGKQAERTIEASNNALKLILESS
ncbi:MAG: SRPBCC family protein [Anaerolineales bacterium]|jgi:carbon monoxide dehydrogenase subunit G